jgi:SagB-type dehydrogenase family enzyme
MFAVVALTLAALWLLVACADDGGTADSVVGPVSRIVQLPDPARDGELSVEAALSERRSLRDWRPDALTLDQLGQVVWAGQGITADWGGRTAPSAGATYPIELHVVVSAVDGLEPGVYRYRPNGHRLELTAGGDHRGALARAALDQSSIADAPVNLVISAVPARTAERYGDRADRYVILEAGHVAQNVALQTVSLGLGSVPIGAFADDEVARIVELPDGELPLYILPIGVPATSDG